MHLDNSACNLASLNLMTFLDDARHVRRRGLQGRDVHRVHRAGDHRRQRRLPDGEDRQDDASVPSARHRLRQPRRAADGAGPRVRLRRRTGVGRRDHRAAHRSVLCHFGAHRGPHGPVRRLPGEPRAHAASVLGMHRDAVNEIDEELVPVEILSTPRDQAWDEACKLGEVHGVRNAQASVLAPTGTIGLLMDCDTTGIEPDLGLVKMKKLVGGGTMSIVNQTVPRALTKLGYSRRADRRRSRLTSTSTSRSSARRTCRRRTTTCSPARWVTTRSTTAATSR